MNFHKTLLNGVKTWVESQLNDLRSWAEQKFGEGGVSSWNDLKDKPFGDIEVEILPETEVVFEYNEEAGMAVGFITLSAIPENGAECTVVYNGKTYICKCTDGFLGNVGAMTGGEDTGEPFIISAGNTVESQFVIPLTEITSATVNIKGTKTEPIPDEYLPNSIVEIDLSDQDMIDFDSMSIDDLITVSNFPKDNFEKSVIRNGTICLYLNCRIKNYDANGSLETDIRGRRRVYLSNIVEISRYNYCATLIMANTIYYFMLYCSSVSDSLTIKVTHKTTIESGS